jgi:anti-sigma B factor antagonist
MNITFKKAGDVEIAEIEGSIDSKTAPELQQSILDVIAGTSKIVLDMTKVAFVSSAGLRVLLMVYRQLKGKDGKIVLVGVSEEIRDVMFMTGFISFFEIDKSLDEALRKISA